MLESGVIKIGDFGWSVYSMDNKHKGKCGTPLYMSP
jgi:serine/threonine protein kinase